MPLAQHAVGVLTGGADQPSDGRAEAMRRPRERLGDLVESGLEEGVTLPQPGDGLVGYIRIDRQIRAPGYKAQISQTESRVNPP